MSCSGNVHEVVKSKNLTARGHELTEERSLAEYRRLMQSTEVPGHVGYIEAVKRWPSGICDWMPQPVQERSALMLLHAI
jgi:hypothetical protein